MTKAQDEDPATLSLNKSIIGFFIGDFPPLLFQPPYSNIFIRIKIRDIGFDIQQRGAIQDIQILAADGADQVALIGVLPDSEVVRVAALLYTLTGGSSERAVSRARECWRGCVGLSVCPGGRGAAERL